MDLRKEQAKEYFEEAKLTLISAEAIFEKAEEEELNLWSKVIKTAYDGIENGLAAAIAFKDEIIPKEHPAKVSRFISLWKPPQKLIDVLFKWLGKRGPAQYVDIKKGKISVPYKIFNKDDAVMILEDAKEILKEIEKLIAGREEKKKETKEEEKPEEKKLSSFEEAVEKEAGKGDKQSDS